MGELKWLGAARAVSYGGFHPHSMEFSGAGPVRIIMQCATAPRFRHDIIGETTMSEFDTIDDILDFAIAEEEKAHLLETSIAAYRYQFLC